MRKQSCERLRTMLMLLKVSDFFHCLLLIKLNIESTNVTNLHIVKILKQAIFNSFIVANTTNTFQRLNNPYGVILLV